MPLGEGEGMAVVGVVGKAAEEKEAQEGEDCLAAVAGAVKEVVAARE